jgi:hypothetical protein
MLRQYIYRDQWDYSDSPFFSFDDEGVRRHINHCIETIKVNLMCVGDKTPYLLEKEERAAGEVRPNFENMA